jgi:hypothetical protein
MLQEVTYNRYCHMPIKCYHKSRNLQDQDSSDIVLHHLAQCKQQPVVSEKESSPTASNGKDIISFGDLTFARSALVSPSCDEKGLVAAISMHGSGLLSAFIP